MMVVFNVCSTTNLQTVVGPLKIGLWKYFFFFFFFFIFWAILSKFGLNETTINFSGDPTYPVLVNMLGESVQFLEDA